MNFEIFIYICAVRIFQCKYHKWRNNTNKIYNGIAIALCTDEYYNLFRNTWDHNRPFLEK